MGTYIKTNQRERFKLEVLRDVNSENSFFKDCLSISVHDFDLSSRMFACSKLNILFEVTKSNDDETCSVAFIEGAEPSQFKVFLDISSEKEMREFNKTVEMVSRYKNDIVLNQKDYQAVLNDDGFPRWSIIDTHLCWLSELFLDDKIMRTRVRDWFHKFNNCMFHSVRVVEKKHMITQNDYNQISKLRTNKKRKEIYTKMFQYAEFVNKPTTFSAFLECLEEESKA